MYGGAGGSDNQTESELKSSGKLWLSSGKFQRGRTDQFTVEVQQLLSPLSRLDVGHDNKGPGPGWFLEEVCGQIICYLITFWFIHFTAQCMNTSN